MNAPTRAYPSNGAPEPGIAGEVDELGRIQAQLAQLRPVMKREEELKKILREYGLPVIQGNEFVCTVTTSLEDRLDIGAVRAEMGADWCLANLTTLTKKTVRTAAKTP